MYNIIIILFIFISLMLIGLIVFNPTSEHHTFNYSNNNQFSILNCIYNNFSVYFLIKVFIILFFVFSMIICILNNKN
ncbi:Protein-export membrane protein SecG [Buchnera aphidicola (Myzocallis carpini)]